MVWELWRSHQDGAGLAGQGACLTARSQPAGHPPSSIECELKGVGSWEGAGIENEDLICQ